ncbi:MAG: T9SS type A sorting domain-containing protein [Saprospiraceae bacterium]|nr:T9SS type A sorting domain-containing protein [Saprospiraceae bacterium]
MKEQFPVVGNSSTRVVKAWFDKDGDGVFQESSELIFTSTVQTDDGQIKTISFTNPLPTNLPIIKKYFRLRMMAISNGGTGLPANTSTQETFVWDVAMINNSGSNTVPQYASLDPASVGNKGRILEVEIKKGGVTAYNKVLNNPSSLDYNYFDDGSLPLLYKSIAYQFKTDNTTTGESAVISTDLNFDGFFSGSNEIKTTANGANANVNLSNAWTGTGFSALRINHRTSTSQPVGVGVWEYPIMVVDENAISSTVSGFLTNTAHSLTLNTGTTTAVNHKVVLPIDQENPVSYIDYVKWLTVISARYGNVNICTNQTSPECLFLKGMVDVNDTGGNGSSGLNRLKWVEAGNEPDKFWYDAKYRNTDEAIWQMRAKQYATLLHASYDGANKSSAFEISAGSNKFLGVKNIDPNLKLAMAGISDFRGQYLIDMLNKAESLRGTAVRKVPFDILNIHHYTSTNTPIGADYINNTNYVWDKEDQYGFESNSVGACPECADLKGRYNAFLSKLFNSTSLSTTVKNELSNPTNREFWITELGYDTNNGSKVAAQLASGSQPYYTTQAQWIVRSLLELSPVEFTHNANTIALKKATIFDLRDEGIYSNGTNNNYSPDGYLYTHSGLLTRNFKPKRSWYYVQTLKNVLGECRFNKDLNANGAFLYTGAGSNDPKPRIYDYKEDGVNGRHILVIWSPTSNNSNNLPLNLSWSAIRSAIGEPSNTQLPVNLVNYTVVKHKDFNEKGSYKQYNTVGGQLQFTPSTIAISETPIYVLLNQTYNYTEYTSCQLPGLTITPTCDGGRVTHSPWSGIGGDWTIMYALQSDINNIVPPGTTCSQYPDQPFDFLGDNRFKIYSDAWVPNQPLIVNGLQSNTSYVLFFFYTDYTGLSAAKPCVLCFSTNSSAPCNINPCLSLTAPNDPLSCGTFTDDEKRLLINFINNSCLGTVNSSNPASVATCANYAAADGDFNNPLFGANELWSNCGFHEVTVTFQNFVKLEAIKFYHRFGSDDVDILYTCCNCTQPTYLTTFRPYGQVDHWVTIFENMPLLPVKSLTFRKTGHRGPNNETSVEIGKLHFCGVETTSCTFLGDNGSDTKNLRGGSFEDIKFSVSDDGAVAIHWAPVPHFKDHPEYGTFDKYEAWIAPKKNNEFEKFNANQPTEVRHYTGVEELNYFVGQLEPGDYSVLISIPKPPKGCEFSQSMDNFLQSSMYDVGNMVWADTIVSFSVLPNNKDKDLPLIQEVNKVEIHQPKTYHLEVFPNPTSGHLSVAWDTHGFQRLDIISFEGSLIKSVNLETNQVFSEQIIAGLPSGIYLVRLSGEGLMPRQKKVVLTN